MPEYRRVFRPGGTFFFTIVTYDRRPLFREPANVDRLRSAIRAMGTERPFEFDAGVVLHDHMHSIWTMPAGDSDNSMRIGRMRLCLRRPFERRMRSRRYRRWWAVPTLRRAIGTVKAKSGNDGFGSMSFAIGMITNTT